MRYRIYDDLRQLTLTLLILPKRWHLLEQAQMELAYLQRPQTQIQTLV
jgi:hypothetical protein